MTKAVVIRPPMSKTKINPIIVNFTSAVFALNPVKVNLKVHLSDNPRKKIIA